MYLQLQILKDRITTRCWKPIEDSKFIPERVWWGHPGTQINVPSSSSPQSFQWNLALPSENAISHLVNVVILNSRKHRNFETGYAIKWVKKTLKGSLSVLKLMPGTYFSQTGKPLHITKLKVLKDQNGELISIGSKYYKFVNIINKRKFKDKNLWSNKSMQNVITKVN